MPQMRSPSWQPQQQILGCKAMKTTQKLYILRAHFGVQKMDPKMCPLIYSQIQRPQKRCHFLAPKTGQQNSTFLDFFSAASGGLHGDRGYTQFCLAHPCTDNPRHKTTTRPHIEWKVGPVLRPNNGPISGAIFWTLFLDRPRGTNCASHFVVAIFWARKRPLFWGRGRAPKHDQKTEKSHSLKHYWKSFSPTYKANPESESPC